MAKSKLTVKTDVGTFTRQTDRTYTHIVVVEGVPAKTAERDRLRMIEWAQDSVDYLAGEIAKGETHRRDYRGQPYGEPYAEELEDRRRVLAERQALPVITADVRTEWAVIGWAGRLDLARKVADSAVTPTKAKRSRTGYVAPAQHVHARIYDVATGLQVSPVTGQPVK